MCTKELWLSFIDCCVPVSLETHTEPDFGLQNLKMMEDTVLCGTFSAAEIFLSFTTSVPFNNPVMPMEFSYTLFIYFSRLHTPSAARLVYTLAGYV